MYHRKFWCVIIHQCPNVRQVPLISVVPEWRHKRVEILHFTGHFDVCLETCSDEQQNHQNPAILALCAGNPSVSGGFPWQRACSVERVSMLWRHHVQTRLLVNTFHDEVIKWKHFPRYWPFVRGIHRSPVNSPHKGQCRGALVFSLICAWINSWVNNREAGDLRRHCAHYDVTIMSFSLDNLEKQVIPNGKQIYGVYSNSQSSLLTLNMFIISFTRLTNTIQEIIFSSTKSATTQTHYVNNEDKVYI